MKTMKMMLHIVAAVLAAVSCGSKKEAPQKKVLVLYYSQVGSTKAVAQELATKLSADMEEIVPVRPYDGDFQGTVVRNQQEVEQGILPELDPIKADLAQYDVIFLGFPVWNGTYAPPVASFLETADLSGNTVVPFCSFGSGGQETAPLSARCARKSTWGNVRGAPYCQFRCHLLHLDTGDRHYGMVAAKQEDADVQNMEHHGKPDGKAIQMLRASGEVL